jgi:hypothetical protein
MARTGERIQRITSSPKKNKRFRVILENGDSYDFGLLDGSTYVDHGDKSKRYAYWARHYGNDRERQLIDSLTPSPALYSAYILWGMSRSIQKNISKLNHHLLPSYDSLRPSSDSKRLTQK